jgi:hypothetical protein
MATYGLRRFSRANTLRTIQPTHLIAFLEPYRRFLEKRGVTWPKGGSEFDYEQLAQIFLNPDADTPRDLIHALHYVDEMATPEIMDDLLEEACKRALMLAPDADQTPADVAVQMWCLDKAVLERKHAENHAMRVRSFASYRMDLIGPFKPTQARVRAMERDLNGWFEQKKRGASAKILSSDPNDGFWYVVRHGDPFKRDESVDGPNTSSVCYRPAKYDVLVYSEESGELRVHARSKGEKAVYCAVFSKHMFGAVDAFPNIEKYTLEPLRELGEDCLAAPDIDGIEYIKLTEIEFHYRGHLKDIVIRKADDVFAVFAAHNEVFPTAPKIMRAVFQIKFSDARTPRSVVIKLPNIAQFTRDDDAVLVEQWLRVRGFIIDAPRAHGDQPDAVLGRA